MSAAAERPGPAEGVERCRRVADGKHQIVPYDPGSNPVSVSFAGSLAGTGAATPPAGLRFSMTLLQP